LPYLRIEENGFVPATVSAGKETSHRLVYVLCPHDASDSYTGVLTRTLRHDGARVFRDVTKDFTLQGGKWLVDAIFVTPPEATPGEYSLDVEFQAGPGLRQVISNLPGKINFSGSARLTILPAPSGQAKELP